VKQNVIPHLISGGVPHFISNRSFIDKDEIKNSKFVGGHFGRMPIDLMNNPTVFSVIRDPVERFISYFKYTTGLIRMGEEAEEKLDNWLYGDQSEIQSNSQSKFLTGKINIDKFNEGINFFQKAVNNNWFIEDYSLELDDVLKNLDKMYYYSMVNHDIFIEDLNKALKEKFGFTTFKHKDKSNSSPDIGLEFSKKDIDRILELNQLDLEVYEYVQKNKKRY
jgi:hypothetical protein